MAELMVKGRLYHEVPGWVPDGSVFHVRARLEIGDLTDPELAGKLLQSVQFYHESKRWFCRLFLLMPDHWHALLSFPRETGMSQTIRAWKAYHARTSGIVWQRGFFDHCLRNEAETDAKADYIRQNAVVKGLCAEAKDWRWRWSADRSA